MLLVAGNLVQSSDTHVLTAYLHRLLLHTETADGTVVPVWEEVIEENVLVLKDIMEARRDAKGVNLHYTRVPITAEKPPDFADLSDLIDVVMRTSISTPIVVNCQLGRGRSTLASVRIAVLHVSFIHFPLRLYSF